MRTRFQINVHFQFKRITTDYIAYDGIFLGKIRVATYKRSLTNLRVYDVQSVIRGIPLGTYETESGAKQACIDEVMLLIERLSHD